MLARIPVSSATVTGRGLRSVPRHRSASARRICAWEQLYRGTLCRCFALERRALSCSNSLRTHSLMARRLLNQTEQMPEDKRGTLRILVAEDDCEIRSAL